MNIKILKNLITHPKKFFLTDEWKQLPSWIKFPAIYIYKRITREFKLDKQLLGYLVEFYNYAQHYENIPLTFHEGIKMLDISWRFVNDLWKIMNPTSPDEILKFYEVVPWYIFDIARTHMLRSYRRLEKRIIEECRGKILNYGGGIGDLSVKLAMRGHDVTHLDVPGKTLEFAKYYFNKKRLNIKIIVVNEINVSLPDYYDTIICLEVIEHVPNPKDILQELANKLRKNGRLIITQLDCKGSDESNPMHFKINFNAEELLNSMGLYKSNSYSWLWLKE
jgi:2-polyprenyl-3-methyl-5-hydroxy-6-metoxy-1,4-benzoquinol methylase